MFFQEDIHFIKQAGTAVILYSYSGWVYYEARPDTSRLCRDFHGSTQSLYAILAQYYNEATTASFQILSCLSLNHFTSHTNNNTTPSRAVTALQLNTKKSKPFPLHATKTYSGR